MAYDEDLANRLREQLAKVDAVSERRMFGGLAFLVNGNMAVAASGQGGLLLRANDSYEDEPHAAPFVMRGMPMDGWLRITEKGCEDDAELAIWVARGVAAAKALPPKA